MAAVQELLDCRISSWYPRFQRVTFRTVILPLPQPVVDWLVSDGLQLPEDTNAFATRGPQDVYATEDEYREWTESDGEEEGDGGSSSGGSSLSAAQPPPVELAGVQQRIAEVIEELGGRVVPKLSWSVPKDAVWISLTSSLCCTNAEEVLLMLRSSDRVAHDICSALQDAAASDASAAAAAAASAAESVAAESDASNGVDAGSAAADQGKQPAPAAAAAAVPAVQHCLALRRWYDLQPGREFRCFVRAQQLAGISQRDLTQCFQFLREERAELADAIVAFHAKHIQGRFPHPHYTYDVYVATSGAVRLLDFNPEGGTTSPLLFTWQELRLAPGEGVAAEGQAEAAAAECRAEAAAAEMQAEAADEGQAKTGDERLAAEGAEPAAAAAAGHLACCGEQGEVREVQQTAEGEASGAPPAAATPAAAEAPSYREQLRRVQALSLTHGQPAQQAQQQGPQGQQHAQHAPLTPHQQQAEQAAGHPAQQQQQQQHSSAAPPPTTATGPVHHHQQPPPTSESSSPSAEFRIIEEAVAMRPSTLAYGVPYDFIDSSEGSALDRLMQQAQQTGAGELWATLAAQGAAS